MKFVQGGFWKTTKLKTIFFKTRNNLPGNGAKFWSSPNGQLLLTKVNKSKTAQSQCSVDSIVCPRVVKVPARLKWCFGNRLWVSGTEDSSSNDMELILLLLFWYLYTDIIFTKIRYTEICTNSQLRSRNRLEKWDLVINKLQGVLLKLEIKRKMKMKMKLWKWLF